MADRRSKRSITGSNLRPVLKMAEQLGFTVRAVDSSGDVLVSHPFFTRPLRVSIHRKDCPRALSNRVGQLLRFRDSLASHA